MFVIIYLNEARGAAFDGFDGETAELQIATHFEVEDANPEDSSSFLESIYDALNIGGTELMEHTSYSKTYREEGNRSLSVGDVIEVSGKDFRGLWAVGKMGFAPISRKDRLLGVRRGNVKLLKQLGA